MQRNKRPKKKTLKWPTSAPLPPNPSINRSDKLNVFVLDTSRLSDWFIYRGFVKRKLTDVCFQFLFQLSRSRSKEKVFDPTASAVRSSKRSLCHLIVMDFDGIAFHAFLGWNKALSKQRLQFSLRLVIVFMFHVFVYGGLQQRAREKDRKSPHRLMGQ